MKDKLSQEDIEKLKKKKEAILKGKEKLNNKTQSVDSGKHILK